MPMAPSEGTSGLTVESIVPACYAHSWLHSGQQRASLVKCCLQHFCLVRLRGRVHLWWAVGSLPPALLSRERVPRSSLRSPRTRPRSKPILLPGLQCGAPEASTPSFGCEQSLHFPGSFCQVRGRSPMGLLFEVAAVNQRLVVMREKSIICPGLQSAAGFRVYI